MESLSRIKACFGHYYLLSLQTCTTEIHWQKIRDQSIQFLEQEGHSRDGFAERERLLRQKATIVIAIPIITPIAR